LCLVGTSTLSLAAALTPAQQAAQDAAVRKSFSDAQALANGATGGASANVTNGTVQTRVNSFNPTYYSYSNTAPETALFLGGNGDTFTAGAGKITACQTGAANPDAFKQQNCDAINFMAKNPSTRPQFTINPSDFASSRAIEASASAMAASSLGFVSPSAVGAFSGCTTKTVTTPATYTTEVCNDFVGSSSQMCTIGRAVVVNANTNYQCDKTLNAYQTRTCTKTLNAVVTPTPYCSVSGSASGIGSYTANIRVYNAKLRKRVLTATAMPYGLFNVVFACAGDALANVTVTIAAGAQCHGGGCNSDYYPLTLNFIPGRNATTSGYQARVYTGGSWHSTSITYDGTTNTVWLSDTYNLTRETVTATVTPTGTVGIRNDITSSWVNGCATQEAAAL